MNEWFRDVVIAWREAGIVPVFANGNSGPGAGTVGVPANYPESIGVGNTTKDDTLNSGSSRGPSPYGEIKPELLRARHRRPLCPARRPVRRRHRHVDGRAPRCRHGGPPPPGGRQPDRG